MARIAEMAELKHGSGKTNQVVKELVAPIVEKRVAERQITAPQQVERTIPKKVVYMSKVQREKLKKEEEEKREKEESVGAMEWIDARRRSVRHCVADTSSVARVDWRRRQSGGRSGRMRRRSGSRRRIPS